MFDKQLNVVFDKGFYKEPMENIYKQYIEEKKAAEQEEDSFGAEEAVVLISMPDEKNNYFLCREDMDEDIKDVWMSVMGDLYVCSMEGMTEMFDCTVDNQTAMIKACGFEPYLSAWSPYHGGIYAVILALAQIVAVGGDCKKAAFSFKEYFEEDHDMTAMAKVFATRLGAYEAQKGFGLEIPENQEEEEKHLNCKIEPTLVAFGECETNKDYMVTPEFKRADNKIVRFCIPYDKYGRPVYEEAVKTYKQIHKMMKKGYIQAACPVSYGGTLEALAKMCFANELGVRLDEDIRPEQLTQKAYGAIVAEIKPRDIRHIEIPCMFLGEVIEDPVMEYLDVTIPVEDLEEAWENHKK